jgi:outer membrane protein
MLFSRVLRVSAIALALAASTGVAQAMSLREAFEYAYANNPNIMSAFLSVKMAAEDIALRKAGKLPQIDLTISGGGSFAATNGTFTTGHNYRVAMGYQQTLFDNFKTEAQIEQARAFAEVSKYALRNAEQNVLLSVATAYMNVVRDTQLVDMRSENVKFFQAQLDSSNSRLRLGEGTQIEVSQSDTRLAAAVATYRSAIASLQTSQASFERWVGKKPRNLVANYNFNGALPKSIDDAVYSAESQNPAILTARAAIRASQAGSDAAKAAFGPILNLTGSLCGVGCFNANPDQGGMTGSVGLSLTIPIYSGGALGASVRKANLDQIQSEVDAMATRDQVKESVISAWSSLQNATAQIQSAQSAVESGQLVVNGTIQERDVGSKTTLDVLNAQAELTTAREALIVASSNRLVASFALLAAAGRLSATDLHLNVAEHVPAAESYQEAVEDTWADLRSID